ncbi:MAG: box helicase domain protein [Cytophagaceae bacterium]|nr:box helicase domain protein [Cytophagaceae bacterium]
MGFEQFKINKQLLEAISDLGYEHPTEVQEKVIPQVFAGHDLFGVAQTGTGKTAAYLIPIIRQLNYAQGNDPRALVMAPTRELVMQIEEQAQLLAKYTDLRIVALYGGIGPKTQIETVKKGIDLVIATPGRFMEIYLKEIIVAKYIKYWVLDEADKMMDMGFMPQIRKMLEILPRKRQNLLFSATLPEKVVKLSEDFLLYPMKISVTPQAMTATTIEQVLYEVPNFQSKLNLLLHLLKDIKMDRLIVFARTRTAANQIFDVLSPYVGESIRVIHANKGQNTRINSIDDFKEGSIRVLVATDVAARGIDITMVSHVVNFDVPLIYEDYVHRIGRTGRAGNLGVAITFMNPAEEYHVRKIEKLIAQRIKRALIPSDVEFVKTPHEERQAIAREVDDQKRKENPDFKGAFHEKKERMPEKTKKRPRR